jgi:hypothetical protein
MSKRTRRQFLEDSVLAAAVAAALPAQSLLAADGNRQHPYLLGTADDVARLRQKFNEPRFAAFKKSLLAEAQKLMTYQGNPPEPGKDIGPANRAWNLQGQKMESCADVLPWAYLLTGEPSYRDMYLRVMHYKWDRRYNFNQHESEFYVTNLGAAAAFAYDWLWPELSPEERRRYGEFLDQFLQLRAKPSWSWTNNIGATYFAGTGLVALARLDENPKARPLLAECLGRIKNDFYPKSILPHPDSGYPEGPLYRTFALQWVLAYMDVYQRVTGDTRHGLLDPPFFRNSPRYIETLLGGDGVWVTFNDCQPQLYGGAWSAYLGAHYNQPLLRWFADYVLSQSDRPGTEIVRHEEGPPYTVFAFLWRDDKEAEFPGLPTLSILPSLNNGCLRSDRTVRPGLMIAVRGRGADEHGHNQSDTGSFVLYSRGENFLIDPGYYQPAAESHSLLLVDGLAPTSGKTAPLEGLEENDVRCLAVDATAAYAGRPGNMPQRVRRLFTLVGQQAAIIVDDVVPGKDAPGNVTTLWQAAFKPEMLPNQRGAIIEGKQGRLWLGTFGPDLSLTVEGPKDFGRSWVYNDMASRGVVAWHTLKATYTAAAYKPLVTVLVPLDPKQPAPKPAVSFRGQELTVNLGRTIHFYNNGNGWIWKH